MAQSTGIFNPQRALRNLVVAESKNMGQIIWGVALVLAGIGVFFRIPQMMPRIAGIESFAPVMTFIKFSFYFIGVLLVGGGAKKLHDHWPKAHGSDRR